MTQVSRPWSGTSTGDAGAYTDNQWATTWSKMIGFGANSVNRGVVRGVDDDLRVTAQSPASNAVDVNTGSAVVQGKWYESTAVENFTVSANGSGNPRIDTIVLQADYTAQTVRLVYKTGTPAATPAAPSLTQTAGATWEIPLADIEVANGFSTITQDNIINRQDWANVPNQIGFDVINGEATDLLPGQLVVWDTANAGEVILYSAVVTAPELIYYAGIVSERIPSGGVGRVVTRGLCYVLLGDTVSAMSLIGVTQDETLSAFGATLPGSFRQNLGFAIEGGSAGDRVLAYVDIPQKQTPITCVLNIGVYSVPNGVLTAIPFAAAGNELSDRYAMHDLVTNNTRITIRESGIYQLSGVLIYDASFAHTTTPFFAIRTGGTTFVCGDTKPTGTIQVYHSINVTLPLVANSYIELLVNQTSGSARNAYVTFSATKIEAR